MNSIIHETQDYVIYKINNTHYVYRINTNTYIPLSKMAKKILLNNCSLKEKNYLKYITLLNKFFNTNKNVNFPNPENIQYREYTLKLAHTTRCNLKCKYCFANNKSKKQDMNLETAKNAINFFLFNFVPNHAEKIIIDLTGCGEPLLRLDFILAVNNYVKQIKKEENINIFCQFATNGMLLDQKTSSLLKKNNILFGVSLDGNKHYSKSNRKGLDYEKVINNIYNIINKEFFGLAATYTGKHYNLLKIFKNLSNHNSEVIGMKPVRLESSNPNSINLRNIKKIQSNYIRFSKWLFRKTSKNNLEPIKKLLKGEDYFARFLRITLHPSHLFYRCSSGLNSFAVDYNGNILICPAFINKPETFLGNINKGFDYHKYNQLKKLYADNNSNCKKCWARYACGGECFNLSYSEYNNLSTPIKAMCELKKFLIMLSTDFWTKLHLKNLKVFNLLKKLSL